MADSPIVPSLVKQAFLVTSLLFVGITPTAMASPLPNHDNDLNPVTQKLTYAVVNITYRDPVSDELRSEEDAEMGMFGSDSRIDSEWGWLVHVRTADNRTHGCSRPINAPAERWIALIERGTCRFQDKIHNAAVLLNASAVIVYNYETKEQQLLTMKHSVSDVVSIFVSKQNGERLAGVVDNGTRVLVHISVGRTTLTTTNVMNRTSVLFVAVSFIVLMVISLAWLVFYYVQRFRYAHTKDRLAKRVMNAAKKAVNRMGQKTLHRGDRETDPDFDLCAICVEGYRVSETVRILPCKHIFHKSCVDPWLIEHRSCPMCKLDILQASGIHLNARESQASNASANTDFESPYFLVEASELLLRDNNADVATNLPESTYVFDATARHLVAVDDDPRRTASSS